MRVLICAIASLALPAAAASPPPAAFGVEGRAVVLTVHAEGAQVYACKAGPDGKSVWSFREPIATLIEEDATVGRHFAGPRWTIGEETVRGKLAATAPGATPADIPLLKLDIVERTGGSALRDATLVLRLNTKGGALSGPCEGVGKLRAEPYSADYVFLR